MILGALRDAPFIEMSRAQLCVDADMKTLDKNKIAYSLYGLYTIPAAPPIGARVGEHDNVSSSEANNG